MTEFERKTLLGFYRRELTANILPFWLDRCEDRENGGYFNCFDNRGEKLVSRDKYTWSQGRFVWMFSRLSMMTGDTFTQAERAEFLRLAKSGADFLRRHVLLGPDDWRCAFLMDEYGNPKYAPGMDRLDASIYADGFVAAGCAQYAMASGDADAYHFARRLYDSIVARICAGDFATLPYPLSAKYRAHGVPMILTNVSHDVHLAAKQFDPQNAQGPFDRMRACLDDVLDHFVDENGVLREIRTIDNREVPSLLGRHANPGHTLEDCWFMLDAAALTGDESYLPRIADVARKMLPLGWDSAFGGFLHYCGLQGGEPVGDPGADGEEPMLQQVLGGWGDKLWWVHSEVLYITLRLYLETGDAAFMDWHRRTFEYTFRAFPNPDRNIREWVQILKRDGSAQDKVVALPVKDPYHITRNLLLLIELLEKA